MRGGPKQEITAEPLDFSWLPEDPAERRIQFIERYLKVPKGRGANKPVHLMEFQKDIIKTMYGSGVHMGVVSLPRGNGKTSLAAMLALAELFIGQASPEVLVVAPTLRQATITLKTASQMAESSEELAPRCQFFKDKLSVPHTNGELIPLPSEEGSLHGFDPSLLIMDELHEVNEEVWEAATSVSGKRPESLILAISTPASSKESIMWSLVKYGRDDRDPAFRLMEYGADKEDDPDDPDVWLAANPASTGPHAFLSLETLSTQRNTLRDSRFRQLRLGVWVDGTSAWIDSDLLAERLTDRKVEDGAKVVLGFDGSASGDSTVLIAATVEANPHIWPIAMWQNPGDDRWRVPRSEVIEKIQETFEKFDVHLLAVDPWGWRSELEELSTRYGKRKVIEFNTGSLQRMAPATDKFYQAVVQGDLTLADDPAFIQHFHNAVAKSTTLGDSISKDKKNSKNKIDAAVGSILAFDQATKARQKKSKAVSFR